MIIDGEPDDIVYDDYDDDVVAESEEEIDEKYGKEPEGFHDDEDQNEEEFDEDVDEDVGTEDATEDDTEDDTENDGEDETGDDSWDNLKMSDFEFEIEKESIPAARFLTFCAFKIGHHIENRSFSYLFDAPVLLCIIVTLSNLRFKNRFLQSFSNTINRF